MKSVKFWFIALHSSVSGKLRHWISPAKGPTKSSIIIFVPNNSGKPFTGQHNTFTHISRVMYFFWSFTYSGQTFTGINKVMELADIQFISDYTYYTYQRDIIIPVINSHSTTAAQNVVEQLKLKGNSHFYINRYYVHVCYRCRQHMKCCGVASPDAKAILLGWVI